MLTTRYQHVRVYQVLRSAHLERATKFEPATVLFSSRRYDFDDSLVGDLDVIHAGLIKTVLILLRSDVTICEINEPLQRGGLTRTAASVAALRLKSKLVQRRVQIVCYAIENNDPYSPQGSPNRATASPGARAFSGMKRVKHRARERFDAALSAWLATSLDKIVYGTTGSESLYRSVFSRQLARARHMTVPALPEPCDCPAEQKQAHLVVFVGAFEPRKGFDRLLESWNEVAGQVVGAKLLLIGKGSLADSATELARVRQDVEVVNDPPRSYIHQALRRASVLVLLSQRTPRWREQVGLPIVEALAHGCKVVTTRETGLANWLADHHHWVLEPDASASGIAQTIILALDDQREASSVVADLPETDGRRGADLILFSG